MSEPDAFCAAELRALRKLRSPADIQRFLDEIPYNLEPGGATCLSPRKVLRERRAHCMEGALLAAAILRNMGHPAQLVDLEAVRDSDHVIAVYRAGDRWGALAKSDYSGLRSREPVYRSIRELVMSYFEHYYNPRGEKTLRAFSNPVNLARFNRRRWVTSEEDVWYIPEHLCEIPHFEIVPRGTLKYLARMDARLYAAGRLGGAAH
ncbi:MAG: transglutaminase-like domain-containing protein [Bryobacteraceae bacterium]|nr:transglutaminase-like domain-containing protein [Bryobacteraceae bacterium]